MTLWQPGTVVKAGAEARRMTVILSNGSATLMRGKSPTLREGSLKIWAVYDLGRRSREKGNRYRQVIDWPPIGVAEPMLRALLESLVAHTQ